MNISQLAPVHKDLIKPLFYRDNYMGIHLSSNYIVDPSEQAQTVFYNTFVDTYLSGLRNYIALGLIEDGEVKSLISFYMSPDEPCWYGTMIRSLNDKKYVRPLLDAAMDYNEVRGRFKFYTLWNADHGKLLRRFAFSKQANERYDYVDEILVNARTKCVYTNYWQILFNRTLLPVDSIVRCTFLKQEYRLSIPLGGGL
jgi:hypothetical protein